MKTKIFKALSIMLTLAVVLSTCLCAIGTVSAAEANDDILENASDDSSKPLSIVEHQQMTSRDDEEVPDEPDLVFNDTIYITSENFDEYRDLAIEALRKRLEKQNIFESEITPFADRSLALRAPVVSRDEKDKLQNLIQKSSKLECNVLQTFITAHQCDCSLFSLVD